MKKFITAILAFLSICLVMPTAFAETITLDGFSITLPDDFDVALTPIDIDEGTDYFSPESSYEAETAYEILTVDIGVNKNLNTLFDETFDYARREDLDLSILTENQLSQEADAFAKYIDDSFPVYMTYLSPTSITTDGRLGLVVTGYYTDSENNLTGELRAYEFFYLDKVIIIYYDTQIEGLYFNDAVFEISDSIVSSLDFETDISTKLTNPETANNMIDMASTVFLALIIALILGFLFGKLRIPAKEKESIAINPQPVIAQSQSVVKEQQKPSINQSPAEQKPKQIAVPRVDESTRRTPENKAEPQSEEAVDWKAMIADLKKQQKENIETHVTIQDEPVEAQPQAFEKPEPEAKIEIAEQPSSEKKEDHDPSNNIDDTLDSEFMELSRLAKMVKEKLNLGKKREDDTMDESAKKENIEENTDYQAYLDKLLPQKKVRQKKSESELEKMDLVSSVSQSVSEKETNQKKDETSQEINASSIDNSQSTDDSLAKKPKQGNIFIRALSKIVHKIETSEDEPDPSIPEFESRTEMHISEKTEKNPVDKLMPGLFADDTETLPDSVKFDANIDIRAESTDLPTELDEKEHSVEENEDNESDVKPLPMFLNIFKKKNGDKE